MTDTSDLVKRSPAHHALMNYQQADMEGIMVTVSRQAIHEVDEEITRLQAELDATKDKLAKAVEALQGLVPILCEGFEDGCGKLSRHDCAACEGYATLAELTGGKDE